MTDETKALVEHMRETIREWERDEPRDDWWLHQHDHSAAADLIEELDRHLTLSGKVSKALSERIEALEAENERLRDALLFYANNKNYRYIIGVDCTSVDIDAGDTARAALAGDSHD